MWVHESFANYAEGLYTECLFGKDAGARYIIGNRRGIRNDRPIIPDYGVNDQGSGDMYPKGGEMLHTIRQLVNDDEKWRGILRGLNKTFWHQTVMGKQVEDYISAQAGMNLVEGVRSIPAHDSCADVRVPHLGRHAVVSVGQHRPRIRHADPRDARLADVVAHQARRRRGRRQPSTWAIRPTSG